MVPELMAPADDATTAQRMGLVGPNIDRLRCEQLEVLASIVKESGQRHGLVLT